MRMLKGVLLASAMLAAGPVLAHGGVYGETGVTIVLGGDDDDFDGHHEHWSDARENYWEDRVYYAPRPVYWPRPWCWHPHSYGGFYADRDEFRDDDDRSWHEHRGWDRGRGEHRGWDGEQRHDHDARGHRRRH